MNDKPGLPSAADLDAVAEEERIRLAPESHTQPIDNHLWVLYPEEKGKKGDYIDDSREKTNGLREYPAERRSDSATLTHRG